MAKFAKIIQENNENFLIKKFIKLFRKKIIFYSTVTDFAKFLGLSISQFFNDAT